MDNLNTHNTSSLYEAFPPEKARELAKRLEIHYTPKHGSWLNIAEIELRVLEDVFLVLKLFALNYLLGTHNAILPKFNQGTSVYTS